MDYVVRMMVEAVQATETQGSVQRFCKKKAGPGKPVESQGKTSNGEINNDPGQLWPTLTEVKELSRHERKIYEEKTT
jgi:hypothetical protein